MPVAIDTIFARIYDVPTHNLCYITILAQILNNIRYILVGLKVCSFCKFFSGIVYVSKYHETKSD